MDDCSNAAILSRELEEPREFTDGRFDRARHMIKKAGNSWQTLAAIYQQAWTTEVPLDLQADCLKFFEPHRGKIAYLSGLTRVENYTIFTVAEEQRTLCAKNTPRIY